MSSNLYVILLLLLGTPTRRLMQQWYQSIFVNCQIFCVSEITYIALYIEIRESECWKRFKSLSIYAQKTFHRLVVSTYIWTEGELDREIWHLFLGLRRAGQGIWHLHVIFRAGDGWISHWEFIFGNREKLDRSDCKLRVICEAGDNWKRAIFQFGWPAKLYRVYWKRTILHLFFRPRRTWQGDFTLRGAFWGWGELGRGLYTWAWFF